MTAPLPPRPGEGRSRGQRRGRDSHPFGGPIGPKRFSRPCGSASRPTRSRSCLRVSASTVAPLTPAREEKQEATTDDSSYCFPCKATARTALSFVRPWSGYVGRQREGGVVTAAIRRTAQVAHREKNPFRPLGLWKTARLVPEGRLGVVSGPSAAESAGRWPDASVVCGVSRLGGITGCAMSPTADAVP